MKCKIKKLSPTAIIPKYQTSGSAAFDICSLESVVIQPNDFLMLRTGIAVEIPKGYCLTVRQRSGLSKIYHNYLTIGVGTVDSDYRGEILVPIVNRNSKVWFINAGDRIVQGIIQKVYQIHFKEVDELG